MERPFHRQLDTETVIFPLLADMLRFNIPLVNQSAYVGERKARRGKKARRKSKLTRLARRRNR